MTASGQAMTAWFRGYDIRVDVLTVGSHLSIRLRPRDIMWFLLALVCVAYATPCPPCICREFQNIISCVGKNVTEIPKLQNGTEWIRHANIHHSGVKNIDTIKQWQNLESVDIRDIEELPCENVI